MRKREHISAPLNLNNQAEKTAIVRKVSLNMSANGSKRSPRVKVKSTLAMLQTPVVVCRLMRWRQSKMCFSKAVQSSNNNRNRV